MFQEITENDLIPVSRITDVQMKYLSGKNLRSVAFAQIKAVFILSVFSHNCISARGGNVPDRFG